MKEVAFFYGLGSRYSYIAATQITRIEEETSARFDWFPVFSGRLIRQSPQDPFALGNRRGQYEEEYRKTDAKRWANYYSIPFEEPNTEGVDWSAIVRACLAAKSMGHIDTYSLAVFGDVFGGGSPPKQIETLIKLADQVGLPTSKFRALFESDDIANEEEAIQTHASRIGAFGVPTFVVDGEKFWGQDRMPLLVHHLKTSR